jgi:hypothetical protein
LLIKETVTTADFPAIRANVGAAGATPTQPEKQSEMAF